MRELFNRIWKKEEGFSLIELIIVIAILAIIAAIAVPNLLGNIQRSNEGTDQSNAKLIADAIATVIAQNPEWEGTVIAGVSFDNTAATAPVAAPWGDDIIEAAVANLNGTAPVIKARKNATNPGTDFFVVSLAATGDITVVGTDAAPAEVLFPVP